MPIRQLWVLFWTVLAKMSKVGKRIAVLGDMLELGPDSAFRHASSNGASI